MSWPLNPLLAMCTQYSRVFRLNKMIEAPVPGPSRIDSKRPTRIYLDPDVVVSRFSGAFKSGIVRYIADNLDHWLDVGSGAMLRPEDLFFVHGTTKAMYWINEVYLPDDDGDEKKRFGFIRRLVDRLPKLPWPYADRAATIHPPTITQVTAFIRAWSARMPAPVSSCRNLHIDGAQCSSTTSRRRNEH